MTECPHCGVALTFDEMDHAYTCGACGGALQGEIVMQSPFWCDKCDCEMLFDETDYYDFDHWVCPKCKDFILFPADGYGPPDDYLWDDNDDEWD